MDDAILKLRFEAEQRRSKEIAQKLEADAKTRIPEKKAETIQPTVAPQPIQEARVATVATEAKLAPIVALDVPKPPAKSVYERRFKEIRLRDAIVLSEIISKPVSKRR